MTTYAPMLQKYLEIKNNHEDSILLYKMGDFYEMLFEDAVIASKILHLTLTSRNKKNYSIQVPMCGFPVHAVNNYVARLTGSGKKVVICDQVMSDSGEFNECKMRFITPLTAIDSKDIVSKENGKIEDQCSKEEFQQDFDEYLRDVNKSILDLEFMLKEFKNLGLQHMATLYDKKHTKKIITKPLKKIRQQMKLYEDLLLGLPKDSNKEIPDSELAEILIADSMSNRNVTRWETRSVVKQINDIEKSMKLILELHLADFNYQHEPKSSQAIVARAIAAAICSVKGITPHIERTLINSIR